MSFRRCPRCGSTFEGDARFCPKDGSPLIEVAGKAKQQLRIKGAAEAAETRGHPEWLEVDAKALKGKFKARPQRTELPSTINESLVVELYSK